MAIGDIFRLSAIWQTSGGAIAVNRWGFKQDTALVLGTPALDLVGRFRAQVEPGYVVMVSNPYSLIRYEVRGVTDPTYGEDISVLGVSGGVAGEALPFQTAPLISWRTALIGRANRGRTYLPPTGESQASSGVLISGFLTGMGLFVAAMLALKNPDPTFAEWSLGVVGGTPPTFKLVTSGIPRTLVATQRRRVPGVGQ